MEPGSTFSVMAPLRILSHSLDRDALVVIAVIRARRRVYRVDANRVDFR